MPINDCPFCHSGNVEVAHAGPDDWCVACRICGAIGPDRNPDRKIAIYLWNEPTETIDRLSADCDRLRKELDEANNVIR